MNRALSLLLQVALALSAVNATLCGIRIALQQGFGIGQWYWGGAIVVFIAPAALALALFIVDRVSRSGALRLENA